MWAEYSTRKGRALLVAVLVLGLLLRLFVALQPVNVLVEKNLPDDAYYYFVIAHNTVQSLSVSLDGQSVTNGFHPLWWIALLPIFGWDIPLQDIQVHLALILGALLDVLTIWMICQIAAYLGKDETAGLLAGFLYSANPIVILQATNGLETALAMATLSTFLWWLIQWMKNSGSKSGWVWVGVFLGLAFLARSDSIFTLGIAVLGAWWFVGFKKGMRDMLQAGLLAGMIVLPWFLWSYFAVGSLLQESGIAVPFAIRHRLDLEYGGGIGVAFQEAFRQITQPMLWLRGDPTGLPFIIGVVLWIVVIIGLVKRWRNSIPTSSLEKIVLVSLLIGGILMLFFHAALRGYPRIWYFSSMSIAFSLAAALVARSFINSGRSYYYLIIFSSVYYLISGYIIWKVGYYPWQREMFAASHYLSENTQQGDKIGSFNAGIYAYYSERQVVNLDGVVNHDALEAVRNFRILSYLQQQKIDYLIDYDSAIQKEYWSFMGPGYPEKLDEIEILGGNPNSALGYLRLYQVTPP